MTHHIEGLQTLARIRRFVDGTDGRVFKVHARGRPYWGLGSKWSSVHSQPRYRGEVLGGVAPQGRLHPYHRNTCPSGGLHHITRSAGGI